MNNIEIIKNEVTKLLSFDNSGHGIDHINRVLNISINIAEKEKCNIELVKAIALLHDADDYKLFGDKCANSLTNTKNILAKTSFNDIEKNIIINSIKTIGFSKRLEGIIPQIIEAKIVSDADMLDGMGATGILRTYQYNISHNNAFFDKNIFPNLNMNHKEYKSQKNGTSVNHIFEKILKLKDYMLTQTGKKEALKRYEFVIYFLKEFFYEENATEWIDYLNTYIKNNNANINTLLVNINKLHTTKMGIERIKKNLKIDDDVVAYCKNIIINKNCNIYKQGKNWYCILNNIKLTINSNSYTIITAHIIKSDNF